MSAAVLILACGDERRMSRFSFLMHHESSYGLQGRHSDMKHEMKQMERMERLWSKWMEEFSTESAEFWYEKGKNTNLYLDAEECLKSGIIDKLI